MRLPLLHLSPAHMKRLRKPMRVAALTTHSCSFAVNTAAISLMSSEVILVEEGGNTWSIARRHAKTGRDNESTRQQQRLARTRLRRKTNETRAQRCGNFIDTIETKLPTQQCGVMRGDRLIARWRPRLPASPRSVWARSSCRS